MTLFQLAGLFLTLTAAVGWLNARLLRLPQGVTMLAAGLLGAIGLFAVRRLWPGLAGVDETVRIIADLDFPKTVVGYMLAFLLFAGAMRVDLSELRRRRLAVFTLATLGVLASIALVGGGVWLAARALGLSLALVWALVFAALISPTDPVAVLSIVRQGKLSKRLQAILQGEALFNDGVGIVIFLAILAVASEGAGADPAGAALQVLVQAGGGLVLGFAAAFLAIRAMAAIDDHAVEAMLSLALAAGLYAAAEALHLSGPIAVVAAGLLFGDRARDVMSPASRGYLEAFWILLDEILNALLFFLLGLELLVVPFHPQFLGLWAVAIPLVLVARFAVVAPWGAYFHLRDGERGPSLILTWGGLHGALSLALALSIPAGPEKPLLLSMTYAVVVFSVAVQGLTFGPLVAALGRRGRQKA
jgi:CPA1 family monovalent cation:H+ antiporter